MKQRYGLVQILTSIALLGAWHSAQARIEATAEEPVVAAPAGYSCATCNDLARAAAEALLTVGYAPPDGGR